MLHTVPGEGLPHVYLISQYTGPADCRSNCAGLDVETRHMLLQCVLLGQSCFGGDSPGCGLPADHHTGYARLHLTKAKQYGLPCLCSSFCFRRQSLFLMQLLSWTSWSSKVSPNKLNFTPMIQNRIPAAGKIDFMMGSLIEVVCTVCSTYGYRMISSFTTVLLQYTNVGITCVYVDIRTGTMMTYTDSDRCQLQNLFHFQVCFPFDASFTYKYQHCNMIRSFPIGRTMKMVLMLNMMHVEPANS